ncbi:MAG: class I SAM-dependent methyltransferase [Phycisphaerae bacterium]
MKRPHRPHRPATGRRPPAAPPLDEARCRELLEQACDRRAALLADPLTTACRLCHSTADGLPGLVIEKLGDVLVVQLHEEQWTADEELSRTLCADVAERLKARAVYRKVFPRDRSMSLQRLEPQHHDAAPWLGSAVEPELPVREGGLCYLVRPYDGYATGLFLEHRESRRRVRELAAGRRVLNAFAYTCGFTVAAAVGGAAGTVSVDVSRKSLEWGKCNLAANGQPLDDHVFLATDMFDYCRRAQRQSRQFDLVILDPPTFSRTRRPTRVFSLVADLERLVGDAVGLLSPGGLLLLATNHRQTTVARLEEVVGNVASRCGRRWRTVERLPLPVDFAGDPDYSKTILVEVS